MNVLAYSNYLSRFASSSELMEWSATIRSTLVKRIMRANPSDDAWNSFVELLFFVPSEESIEPIVSCSKETLRQWNWTIRRLDYSDPVLRRDNGIAMAVVGLLAVKDIEDLSGHNLRALSENPYIASLRGLRLRKIETFPEHIALISRCSQMADLETLELTKINLSGGMLYAFGEAHLTGMKELKLIADDLVTSDIEDFVQSPVVDNLERLSLSGNYLNNDDLGILLNTETFRRLKILDVSRTAVCAKGLKKKITNRKLPSLEKIILSGTSAAGIFGDELILAPVMGSGLLLTHGR